MFLVFIKIVLGAVSWFSAPVIGTRGLFRKNFLAQPRPPAWIIILPGDVYYVCGLMLCRTIVVKFKRIN